MFVCCNAAEWSCNAVGECLCPADRPSPIFTMYAWVLNIIVAIIGIVKFVASDSSQTCTNPMLKIWYIIMFVICGLNMMFSIYLYMRFTSKIRSGETAGKAANQLFLYDFGVYFYIWFVVFIIIWLVLSGGWSSNELLCVSLANTAPIISAMVIYLVGGFFVIMLSMVTECCRSPRWTAGPVVVAARPVASYPETHYQPMPAYQPAPVQQGYPAGNQYAAQPAPSPYGAPPATNPNYSYPAQQQQQPPPRRGPLGTIIGAIGRR